MLYYNRGELYEADKLKNVIGTPDIKVITGVRRSGKSKLLEAFKTYLDSEYANANIIHINYNLSKFEDLKEYHALNEYIQDRTPSTNIFRTDISPARKTLF